MNTKSRKQQILEHLKLTSNNNLSLYSIVKTQGSAETKLSLSKNSGNNTSEKTENIELLKSA